MDLLGMDRSLVYIGVTPNDYALHSMTLVVNTKAADNKISGFSFLGN